MKKVQDFLDELPPEYQKELLDFAEFLLQRFRAKTEEESVKLNWRGALKDKREEYTSVFLQHKSRDWWTN